MCWCREGEGNRYNRVAKKGRCPVVGRFESEPRHVAYEYDAQDEAERQWW